MAGKEYTTAPILVNADGHPIPQYLDITDTTDSPQGTFKPLTQLQAERPDVQNVQLTGSNVEHQLLDQVQISAGSTVFSQNLTHFADKYSVYVQSNPASDFLISIRPRRLDGVEFGEGVDRFEESYTDRVRIVTDEFISRSPCLNIGIRNDTSEVVTYSAWVYVKGASN